MDKRVYEILEKLESNGYLAYIVGGYVRDYLLCNKNILDYDITTNARPNQVKELFSEVNDKFSKYGAIKVKYKGLEVDITTFRADTYIDGKLSSIEYLNDLKSDLIRRDFTINTICMDKDGNIIDLLNGVNDIENKIIKTMRDVKIVFKEDASRIIRAIRFMCQLSFKLSDDILEYIIENKEDILLIPKYKLNYEISLIKKMGKIDVLKEFIDKYKLDYIYYDNK